MSRDSNGAYSLPSGNPVIYGTVISETTHNATMADVRDEITDSLSRSGKGGMLSPFRNMDGTVSAPGVTFTDETSSGTRRAATNDVRHVIAGVDVFGLLKSGSNYIVQLFKGILKLIDPTGGKAVTISPPSGLAADYSLTLPTALPGSTLPVTLTSAGVLSTGQLTSAHMSASAGIASSQLSAGTNSQLAKAWAHLTIGVSSVTVDSQFNVSSASYSGNQLTVNYTSALSSTYNVAVANHPGKYTSIAILLCDTNSTSIVTVYRLDTAGASLNYASGMKVHVVVFGP